ncbi:MAG: UMP kinase [Nanoarchaeota archaeon]|nr:UMP kinase [Nanoarchaeota archaeon]
MIKRVVVISLGGSLIVPDEINMNLLDKFKKILEKNSKKNKFIVVCGGGNTARTYIKGLDHGEIKNSFYLQCLFGLEATRFNAKFMAYFFGNQANSYLPKDISDIENLLKKNNYVFCGALRMNKGETSDATAARLARYFNTIFINLTNVKGLYDQDPKRYPKARFIPEISHKEFYKKAKKIVFKPGQHFILDKKAAKIIKKYNTYTYILGPDMKNLNNLLNNRHFVGTIIDK